VSSRELAASPWGLDYALESLHYKTKLTYYKM